MDIENLYKTQQEERRLSRCQAAQIEYLTTMHYLQSYLHPHVRILDLGAGTGAYALPLAEAGYEVYAVDLMAHHLDILKKHMQKGWKLTLHQGSATDLSMFPDNHFDIILCMGPLYHLKEEQQRICLDEMHRIAKDDGILFCAYLSNLAVFATEALYPNSRFLRSSAYDSASFKVKDDPFVSTYPDNQERMFQNMGFTLIKTFAQDGLGEIKAESINALNKRQFDEWLRFHLAICEQREQLAYSNHIISIIQKHTARKVLFDTARLRLRRLTMQDCESIYAMAKDADVGRMCGWKPHASIKETEEIVSNILINDHTWGITNKADGTLYGVISLDPDPKRRRKGYRMMGYWIGKPHWGKGIVAEAGKEVLRYAFEEWHCHMVSIYHFPFNKQSRRVIEKLGFQFEGILHESFQYVNGEVFDEVCYYMTNPNVN